jgi:CheY-like chemotaxis protein
VAHDFNNVLMVVQSNAALARMLAQRGNAVEPALATIERAVRNGAQLTRQLLAIARRQPLQVRAVRLQSVLPEVARLMASTLGSRIRVSCEVDSEVCPVTLDEAELELAVINLCLNARDAMPEGGEIRIRAELLHAPADLPQQAACAQLTVRDTGEGIPSELISKVTEPFFTTKAAGKGTGLGLSQVYSFVQQCGGRMRIDSEVGRGTVVSLLLPCAAAGSPEQAPEAQDEVVRLDARVLLVEDNPDIAGSLAGLLVHAGARVTRYASAEAAIEAVQGGEHADVVLSDICLEGALTGVDLARTLAREHPGVPVVLVTGYTDRLEEAVALGFQVLPKPAPAQDVVHALHQALKRKQAAAAADAVAVAPAS